MSACCASNYNLCVKQGTTFKKIFTWIAGGCGLSTAGGGPKPVDLTGYTVGMQIRPYPGATDLLYDASADIKLGGVNGTLTLNIPPIATQGFTWWTGVYDLMLEDSSGNVTKLLSGTVTVCPAVTQPGAGGQYVLVPSGQASDVPGGQGILTP